MNEWYELLNDLDTEETPLDEVTQARIVQRAKAALPGRRKKRWVAAAVAAILVLSACGVAVATGQFSDWFWNYSQDPQAPEASEDLLAGLGTVIGQSQTVDGTTITLDGALWDGHSLVLALTVTGKNAEVPYGGTVKTADSWLMPPREKWENALRKEFPDMTEEEFQARAEELWEMYREWNGRVGVDYIYNRRTESYQMQVSQERTAKPDATETELVLHLENLELKGDQTIPGPFNFTFTAEPKPMERVYTGDVVLQTPGGYDCRITKVTVGPLRAEVEVETLEQMPEGVNLHEELEMGALRLGGEEVGRSSSSGSHFLRDEDGGPTHGQVYRGPFHKVVDPAAVEAIQIGGAWVELSELTLVESPDA